MDFERYPTAKELRAIRQWDIKDFPALLEFIEDLHAYPNYLWKKIIRHELFPERMILEWTFCTTGWSGNESLIYALLDNNLFKMAWYYSWQRGGKYVFHIDPLQVGYEKLAVYAARKQISRTAVHKQIKRGKFDVFKLSKNRIFIRVKD